MMKIGLFQAMITEYLLSPSELDNHAATNR